MKYGPIAYAWLSFCSFAFCGPDTWAACSLTVQRGISSGWSKADVSYAVDKNTLRIKLSELPKDDTDSIYIGSIKGCSVLTIEVLNISGNYPWGGKAIGFSFANDPLEPHQWANQASFPPPSGRSIEDGFIKGGLSNNTKLVYEIDNRARTMHFGAKVFMGSNKAPPFHVPWVAIRRGPTMATLFLPATSRCVLTTSATIEMPSAGMAGSQ